MIVCFIWVSKTEEPGGIHIRFCYPVYLGHIMVPTCPLAHFETKSIPGGEKTGRVLVPFLVFPFSPESFLFKVGMWAPYLCFLERERVVT